MKKLALLVAALIGVMSMTASVWAEGSQAVTNTKSVGGYVVELATTPSTAVVGNNQVRFSLRDKTTNQGIASATATLQATMDQNDKSMTMNMSPDNQQAIVVNLVPGAQAGDYVGNLKLTDPGNWRVQVAFAANGTRDIADFDVQVAGAASSGPNWIIIGGFVGAIAVFGLLIATRKKPLAEQPAAPAE